MPICRTPPHRRYLALIELRHRLLSFEVADALPVVLRLARIVASSLVNTPKWSVARFLPTAQWPFPIFESSYAALRMKLLPPPRSFISDPLVFCPFVLRGPSRPVLASVGAAPFSWVIIQHQISSGRS